MKFCPECDTEMEVRYWILSGGYYVDFNGDERHIPKGKEMTLFTCPKCQHRISEPTSNFRNED